ncbi:hypothetical protein HanXRQr2_Chr04g0144561 [Helianthus annuus]|uniref:Uncharacterized protein n=1 Tax=Helianthus annuus TaxID=4232 RepID=A0A9K3NPY8_HELAN|nr:hypothetical protein HanXRQr2_Chr04g0144561 [Helianthus annuus]
MPQWYVPGFEPLPVLTPTPAECATDWWRASCQFFDGYANDFSPLLKKARLSSVPQPSVMVRDQLVGDISNTTTMLVEDNTDSTTMPVDDIARTNTMPSSNNTTSHQNTGLTCLTSLDTHVDVSILNSLFIIT